jgi:hypothetical protein
MKTKAMPTKAEFKFNCPTCGQHILVATQWIGLGISCPSCQSRISIPAPSGDTASTSSAMAPKHTGQTVRIELPLKPDQATARVNGHATQSKSASPVTPTVTGNEPWPELVRRLESGALADPAVLATALFHELMDVRRRLDKLERQPVKDESCDTQARDGANAR